MVRATEPFTILQKDEFVQWHKMLRDTDAGTIISARIARLRRGLKGDTRSVGGGISELKIDHGPGYRLYYCDRGQTLYLLCGGDKRTQAHDIRRAQALVKELFR